MHIFANLSDYEKNKRIFNIYVFLKKIQNSYFVIFDYLLHSTEISRKFPLGTLSDILVETPRYFLRL